MKKKYKFDIERYKLEDITLETGQEICLLVRGVRIDEQYRYDSKFRLNPFKGFRQSYTGMFTYFTYYKTEESKTLGFRPKITNNFEIIEDYGLLQKILKPEIIALEKPTDSLIFSNTTGDPSENLSIHRSVMTREEVSIDAIDTLYDKTFIALFIKKTENNYVLTHIGTCLKWKKGAAFLEIRRKKLTEEVNLFDGRTSDNIELLNDYTGTINIADGKYLTFEKHLNEIYKLFGKNYVYAEFEVEQTSPFLGTPVVTGASVNNSTLNLKTDLETCKFKFTPKKNGGIATKSKIIILGRLRKVTKEGRTSYITYKGTKMSITQARKQEARLKNKRKAV